MAGIEKKSFDDPDLRRQIKLGSIDIVRMGRMTVGREVLNPGWRWSTDVKPMVGTDRCEFHHIGYQVSGRWICESRDGEQVEIGPGDVYDIAPGHDSWVIGDEPAVNIDFQGVAGWAEAPASGDRILTSILFTDLVASTEMAERLGDRGWRRLLNQHHEDVRALLAMHRGHEVKSTGDGFLATFDSPAAAIRTAVDLIAAARRLELHTRAGVHTGEVELMDGDLGGLAVHVAARVVELAGPDEVMVTSTARDLAAGAGIEFEERGSFALKGIADPRQLFAVVG